MLSPEDRTHLVENIGYHLKDAQEFIQKRAVRNFSQADPEYGRRVQEVLDRYKHVSIVCFLYHDHWNTDHLQHA